MRILGTGDGLLKGPEPKRSVWDRQPCESRKALDAFVIYRDVSSAAMLRGRTN